MRKRNGNEESIQYDQQKTLIINRFQDEKEWINNELIPTLTVHFIKCHEEKWLKQIISETFMFKEKEELEQIFEIARSIIAGEKTEIPLHQVKDGLTRENLIHQALSDVLDQTDFFSYESFIRFRLKEYRTRLIHYVEAAIDEYKLEQEYQNFIEDSRRYISLKKPAVHVLHLVHDKRFSFFNENFEEINPRQVLHFVEDQFLREKNIEPTSFVIAPLLSIAPEKLFLYTDQIDNGMVRTIQNIFQERVSIHSKNEVTFAVTKK